LSEVKLLLQVARALDAKREGKNKGPSLVVLARDNGRVVFVIPSQAGI